MYIIGIKPLRFAGAILLGDIRMAKTVKEVLTKSKAAKEARKGEDMGKRGKNFEKITEKGEHEYGSKEAGERVAGSIFQKLRRKGKL